MAKLFTEGLHGEELKETEIGLIPKSWKVVPLGEIARVLNGYAFRSEDYVDKGILNFRVVNIRDEGEIDIESDTAYLPTSFSTSFSDYLLSEGDILLVMVGATRGKLGYLTAKVLPALMNQNMWRIVPTTASVSTKYMYYYLCTNLNVFTQKYSEEARGFFKKEEFRRFGVPLPNGNEQKQIVSIISTLMSRLDVAKRKKQSFKFLFGSMLHQLMTGQIRVNNIEMAFISEQTGAAYVQA